MFELAFADAQGRALERKPLSRKAFTRVMDQRPPLRVLREACGRAHYRGRRFARQGHTVRLLAARDVRPYARGGKTDRHHVAGILEADRCADIASVPVKVAEQQGIQALHRLREHLKGERTATLNCCAGSCTSSVSWRHWERLRWPLPAVREALEDGDNELPMALRHSLGEQLQRLHQLSVDMAVIEQRLEEFASRDVTVQRYLRVPGVGLLTATALRAGAGDLSRFRKDRQLSAWLRLTPREHSLGQQRRFGHLTKRCDAYLRTLLIHGARTALLAARLKPTRNLLIGELL